MITGGAGFLGGFLGRAFEGCGDRVHLLDPLEGAQEDPFLRALLASERAALFTRDLLEPGALEDLGADYTHVVHLAAVVGVKNVLRGPYRTLRDNVLLLERALDFARRQTGLERFVFASSSEVYAGALEQGRLVFPTPEDAPLALPDLAQPRSSYMLSKLYGEAMLRHSGLPFTIVRPHNLYGPRMGLRHVIPELLQKAHHASKGERLEVFSVDHRRTFCFIDDAVELILRLATLPAACGEAYNVGTERPELRMDEVAEIVLRVVGKDLAIEPKAATPGSPPRRCPDMSRATRLSGYQPRVSLEEGIRRTYDWYRATIFDPEPTETGS